ncbi:MAG: permease-like cell division protein FtsX [Salinisphaera sp.]|jgi:cell division transport system permease protein|nr:permease-like cell division protein FtsX [Salinisphaera sp.]
MATSRHRSRRAGASQPATVALRGWLLAHARCSLESLGRLHRRWLTSLLTTLVIGIALALPTGLYIVAKNLDTLSSSWHRSIQISLYLKQDVAADDGAALAQRLASDDDIEQTHFISAAQGLADFRKNSGFGAAIDALGKNPLPGVIEVTPRASMPAAAVSELVERLGRNTSVERAEMDQAWLRRLTAILGLVSRASWVIGLLLSAAVLFIVGNTIRLDIENRREEIEVMKLLGATDAFIRRPFLYSGIWYGLLGSILALVVLGGCYIALGGPLATLTASYNGSLETRGLGSGGALGVLAIGILLGWAGCAISVNRRLAAIEPR